MWKIVDDLVWATKLTVGISYFNKIDYGFWLFKKYAPRDLILEFSEYPSTS